MSAKAEFLASEEILTFFPYFVSNAKEAGGVGTERLGSQIENDLWDFFRVFLHIRIPLAVKGAQYSHNTVVLLYIHRERKTSWAVNSRSHSIVTFSPLCTEAHLA